MLLALAGSARAAAPPCCWTTVTEGDVQWFRTPAGRLFYSKGVNVVNGMEASEKSRRRLAYFWRNFFATPAAWRTAVAAELRGWGFNTRGAWSDPSPDFGLPLAVELDLGRYSKLHWFDPFDPAAEAVTLARARELTAPYRGDPHLLGYFTDNEAGWWSSPLFAWYLKAPWENHTKQALWELLVAHYAGSWRALLADWEPPPGTQGFDDLKAAGTRLRLRPGGAGIRVIQRFTGLCAGRYYALVGRALRTVHPGALVLGDRLPLYYDQDAVRALVDHVDVVSTNYDVDAPDGWVAPYYFDGLRRLAGRPVLVSEFFFAADENRTGNRNVGHLMTVRTQAERARGAAAAVRNFARLPNVVGAHWFQHHDEPYGGRGDGEDYDFGLVDVRNRPYEELVAALATANAELDTLHAKATPPDGAPAPAAIVALPRPVALDDGAVTDWDEAGTRLRGMAARAPYVPFADVHLAWAPEGLYLLAFASNYLDFELLGGDGEFPLSETFQLHLLVERQGRLHHLAVHLLPRRSPRYPDRLEVVPALWRYAGGRPATPLPVAGHVQQLPKPLPHITLEAFIPARWLGTARLAAGTRLRANVVVVGYYRGLAMAWTGPPDLARLEAPETLLPLVLQPPR